MAIGGVIFEISCWSVLERVGADGKMNREGEGVNIYALHVRPLRVGTDRQDIFLKDRYNGMPNKLLIAAFLDNRQACLCRHFIIQTAPETVNSASRVGSRHFDRSAISLSLSQRIRLGRHASLLTVCQAHFCPSAFRGSLLPSTRVEEELD